MGLAETMILTDLLIDDAPEKLCHKCGEYWPATGEFFYRLRGQWYHSPCKACQEEQRQARSAVTPCCVPGCTNPRHRSRSGRYASRCYEHRQYIVKRRERVAK